jgi:hypothetical protein
MVHSTLFLLNRADNLSGKVFYPKLSLDLDTHYYFNTNNTNIHGFLSRILIQNKEYGNGSSARKYFQRNVIDQKAPI